MLVTVKKWSQSASVCMPATLMKAVHLNLDDVGPAVGKEVFFSFIGAR